MKDPRILSNYEGYLGVNNLKEDLDNFFKSKNQDLIDSICNKMMEKKERINGREIPSSAVINAVVLYIIQQTIKERGAGMIRLTTTSLFCKSATNLMTKQGFDC